MKKADWRREIMKKCESVGSYRPEFLPTINTLAAILEERDRVMAQYRKEGSVPVVKRVSDRGAVNSAQNPLLKTWMELNRDALSYWRDLGLTPAGLKKLGEESVKAKPSALAEALRGLD